MRIGIDFDNTIVCYDVLFHRLAIERGLILPETSPTKIAVRDALRSSAREDEWTRLQGEAYGPRIGEAVAFEGVIEFLRACRDASVTACIISHKTRHPFLGEKHNLHAAAYGWLARRGFFTPDVGLTPDDVFLEETKDAKLARIEMCGCDAFIDDLPELLLHERFPAGTQRILFDSDNSHSKLSSLKTIRSWSEALALLPQGVMS